MSARDLPPELLAQVWQHLPRPLRLNIRAAVAKGLEAIKTPEPLDADQWAERHFYLSAESSQGEKRWESYPFQRAMLGSMGDDDIEEVNLRRSARVGYTKMLLATLGYFAQHKRRNQCLWQPTDGDSDEFCKAELEPMLRDVKAMQAVFPQFMAKSKANTLNMKKFLGSLLYLKGGTSAGNFRRMTLQVGMLDEFNAFNQKIEKSADPFTLAHKRLEGATYPKLIAGTTPRIKGLSHIEKRELAAEARMRFNITCPHCQAEHPLQWGGKDVKHGFKWSAEDPEGTVHHVCPHCHGKITQADYLRLWQSGCWASLCGNYRAQHSPYRWTDGEGNPLLRPPRHVAFHIWSAYTHKPPGPPSCASFCSALPPKKPETTRRLKASSTKPWARHGKKKSKKPTPTPSCSAPKTTPCAACRSVACNSWPASMCKTNAGKSPSGPSDAAKKCGPLTTKSSTATSATKTTGKRACTPTFKPSSPTSTARP